MIFECTAKPSGSRQGAGGQAMSTQQASIWQHSNKYSADTACEHCQGVVYHETWCITRSEVVHYAYEAVMDASVLTEGDKLILHALGVTWTDNPCVAA
jgi:hypothetical protein